MAITSADINNQSFSIDRKGYDVDEVDVFLEFVADEIDALNATIDRLQARIAELSDGEPVVVETAPVVEAVAEAVPATEEAASGELADAKARIIELESLLEERKLDDAAISRALISAQRSAEDIIAQANDEAAQIIQDAEDDADRIVENAEKEKQKITNIIRELEDERDDTREEYHDILKDFITDATKKLANIEASMAQTAIGAHRRAAQAAQNAAAAVEEFVAPQAEAQPIVTNQVPVRQESAGIAMSYTTPQFDSVPVAAAQPTASVIEKDLSGYGDVEDDFEFGEID
ncbi:MAG: DivIVA domain-containing protein [Eggerthellaceae bacterium]|nr:DivIVA domain-containing protein [Eggerthellaceae bacterium]